MSVAWRNEQRNSLPIYFEVMPKSSLLHGNILETLDHTSTPWPDLHCTQWYSLPQNTSLALSSYCFTNTNPQILFSLLGYNSVLGSVWLVQLIFASAPSAGLGTWRGFKKFFLNENELAPWQLFKESCGSNCGSTHPRSLCEIHCLWLGL